MPGSHITIAYRAVGNSNAIWEGTWADLAPPMISRRSGRAWRSCGGNAAASRRLTIGARLTGRRFMRSAVAACRVGHPDCCRSCPGLRSGCGPHSSDWCGQHCASERLEQRKITLSTGKKRSRLMDDGTQPVNCAASPRSRPRYTLLSSLGSLCPVSACRPRKALPLRTVTSQKTIVS